jgi:1,4-dihydroxy-2-naphthoate octaprenyltransferase
MKNWILAIRPKTLFASVAPVILGLTAAWYTTGKETNWLIACLTILCAICLQIASNLANDYLDALKGVDTKERLGPVRVTSAGLIPHSQMRFALILTLLLCLILGSYLMLQGGIVIVIMGLLSLYFAYGYTGGPFPLSYNGLGEFAAFFFFGLVAVNGTYYLQAHELKGSIVLLSMGPGFISACILAINNLRDLNSDTNTNKKTIAVRFGEKFQRSFCLILILLSMLTCLYFSYIIQSKWPLFTLLLPLFFHRIWLMIFYDPISTELNKALQFTAIYNLLYCLSLSVSLYLAKTII